jgi:hypothetical protein
MKSFFKKRSLAIQLSIVFIVFVIALIALLIKGIELSTAISIYAVLIAVTVLLISINEIRNRLRPWVAVANIDVETTITPNTIKNYFNIINTGPVPATEVICTVQLYVQKNNIWEEFKEGSAPSTSIKAQTLFPNQRIRCLITAQNANQDVRATFLIKYHGLWAKHTTTNAHRFDHIHRFWTADEPQDYT